MLVGRSLGRLGVSLQLRASSPAPRVFTGGAGSRWRPGVRPLLATFPAAAKAVSRETELPNHPHFGGSLLLGVPVGPRGRDVNTLLSGPGKPPAPLQPQFPHLQSGDNVFPSMPWGAGRVRREDRPPGPGPDCVTYLMASHMSSPIFTQLRAWLGRDTGKPDTQ